jgi:hypothetical protein
MDMRYHNIVDEDNAYTASDYLMILGLDTITCAVRIIKYPLPWPGHSSIKNKRGGM